MPFLYKHCVRWSDKGYIKRTLGTSRLYYRQEQPLVLRQGHPGLYYGTALLIRSECRVNCSLLLVLDCRRPSCGD